MIRILGSTDEGSGISEFHKYSAREFYAGISSEAFGSSLDLEEASLLYV
jgi:hypothetical protein